MRKSLVLAMVAVLVCSSMALAGVPDPARSGTATAGSGSCGLFRFALTDTTWDVLTCAVTLRDAFDTPVASCSTSASASFSGGTASNPFGCFCNGVDGGATTLVQTGTTTAGGVVNFFVSAVGGNGQLDIAITAHCVGNIAIATKSVDFAAADWTANCEVLPGAVPFDISDLSAWGLGVVPYKDLNCDTATDISDISAMGIFGGGKYCQ